MNNKKEIEVIDISRPEPRYVRVSGMKKRRRRNKLIVKAIGIACVVAAMLVLFYIEYKHLSAGELINGLDMAVATAWGFGAMLIAYIVEA